MTMGSATGGFGCTMETSTFLSRRYLPALVFAHVLPVTTSPKLSGIPSGPEKTFVWNEYLKKFKI